MRADQDYRAGMPKRPTIAELEKQIAMQQAECMATVTERVAEVPLQIDRLYGGTQQLSERLARLEMRLCTVLVPRPPEECSKSNADNSSALGSQLLELNLRIGLLNDAVDSITSRLEL